MEAWKQVVYGTIESIEVVKACDVDQLGQLIKCMMVDQEKKAHYNSVQQ